MSSQTLRVLTYNIQGLPDVASKFLGLDPLRFRQIGETLRRWRSEGNGPHIVALQEAFHSRTAELAEAAGYPHISHGPSGDWIRLRSGLCILSEFPIVNSAHTTFWPGLGWDLLARKGAHLADIAVPGLDHPVSILNTHLNSSPEKMFYPEFFAKLWRWIQARHLRSFLNRRWEKKSPLICVGDFNFHKRHDVYETFVRKQDGLPELQNAFDHAVAAFKRIFSGSDPKRIQEYETMLKEAESWIDHQFHAPALMSDLVINPVSFAQRFHQATDGLPLSDHNALEIHYEIKKLDPGNAAPSESSDSSHSIRLGA